MLIDINQNWVAPIRFRPSITDSVVDIKPLKKSLYFQIPPGDILYQSPSKIHLTYNEQHIAVIKAWDTTLMKRCQGLKWINQSNNSYHSSLKPPSIWKWKTGTSQAPIFTEFESPKDHWQAMVPGLRLSSTTNADATTSQ